MNKTFKEKLFLFLRKYAKEHRFLKYPCMICIISILGFYHMAIHIGQNSKRYVSILAVCFFFMLSSSFSSPVLNIGTSQTSEDLKVQAEKHVFGEQEISFLEESDVALSAEQVTTGDEVAVLDDQDVLDGYDNSNLESMDNLDVYTVDDILDDNEQYASVSSNEAGSEKANLVTFDKNDWKLVLINKQHPIPENYTFTLGTIKGNMQCDERIIPEVFAMLQNAKEDGINLVICSPYRDINKQEVLFNRKINAYMSKGMSYMEAYKITSQTVTVPGASEHQIGLALDIVCDSYSSLDDGFGETEAGKWLTAHGSEYGFILRYPKGKEYITSIEYEPWHFRYVGKEAATVIMEKGITLEEFIEGL